LSRPTIELEGNFRFGRLAFQFNDKKLGMEFKRLYRLENRSDDRVLGSFKLIHNDSGFLLVSTFGHCITGSLASLLGAIDAFLDERIRSQASSDLCSVHAATVVNSGNAITCIGQSGSGKTTLSVFLAIESHGGYLGDEYAFLDLTNGTICHEKHPIHVKTASPHAATARMAGKEYLSVLSSCNVLSNVYAPEDFGMECLEGGFLLATIVFPQFTHGKSSTAIRRAAVKELPGLLMPSSVGNTNRALLFQSLMHLIARNHIALYRVQYGDAKDAARKIIARIKEDYI